MLFTVQEERLREKADEKDMELGLVISRHACTLAGLPPSVKDVSHAVNYTTLVH